MSFSTFIDSFWHCRLPKKFYVRRSNNKVDSIETEHIVIAHLFPWSDQENQLDTTYLQLLMIKIYRHHLIYSYNFTCLLLLLSLRLEGEETLKYRCVCRPQCGKVQYSRSRPWMHAQMWFFRFQQQIPFLRKFAKKKKKIRIASLR